MGRASATTKGARGATWRTTRTHHGGCVWEAFALVWRGSGPSFRVRDRRQTLYAGHVQFPATACHRSALVRVARRPRTANPGKSKMVSSPCCSTSSNLHSMYSLCLGYRHQKAPRQEGQPHRPQERGSVLALAGQGAFVLPSLRFCVTKLSAM